MSELVQKKKNHFIVWLPPAVRNRQIMKLAQNISFLVIKEKTGNMATKYSSKALEQYEISHQKKTIRNKCKCIYYIS
jgi:hypothetical protein